MFIVYLDDGLAFQIKTVVVFVHFIKGVDAGPVEALLCQ